MKAYFIYIYILLLFFIPHVLSAQVSAGGLPESFENKHFMVNCQEVSINPPDQSVLTEEDKINDENSLPRRIGEIIPVGLNPYNAGTWENLKAGGRIWRLSIKSEGALAISLYFNKFYLPEGVRMFLYDENNQQVKGAFTFMNNDVSRLFATEMIYGDAVTVELDVPEYNNDSISINISELGYGYRDIPQYFYGKGFGGSDPCEVNVNCSPEGDNWQNEKRGVVRIKVKVGKSEYWCTGSLVNNVRNDETPYLLTADHCAFQNSHYASTDDISQWVFYFNYESPACENPLTEPQLFSLTGATKVASGGHRGNDGSDFFLLVLKQPVPSSYHPFFNGWTLTNSPGSSGVTIHHPEGDIKKISTYTVVPVTSSWNSNGLPSHWKVFWSQTFNNWGVTEGGSSGSPLFDSDGRIIGTLTGGQATCNTQTLPDYYGKFSYHWQSNGTEDTTQLKPWLDPDNTGVTFLNGTSVNVAYHKVKDGISCTIFPNPADEIVNIRFINFDPQDYSISFFNFLGQPVKEIDVNRSSQNNEIKIDRLPPGVYFVKIKADNKEIVSTFVKRG